MRHHFKEADAIGKACQANVFRGQTQVITNCIGLQFRSQGVDEVKDGIGGQCDGSHPRCYAAGARHNRVRQTLSARAQPQIQSQAKCAQEEKAQAIAYAGGQQQKYYGAFGCRTHREADRRSNR